MAAHSFVVASRLSTADAFDRTIDLTRVCEWDRGISNTRHLGGSPGAVGARYEVTVTGFDGSPTTVVYELLDVERPSRFVMEGISDTFRAHDTIVFTATETGCTIDYAAELHLVGNPDGITDAQIERTFPKVVAVAEDGLNGFLNP